MPSLQVRELAKEDIPHIVKYWSTRSPENLVKMGVDAEKLRNLDYAELIGSQLPLPYEQKSNYFVIWMLDDVPIGHSNVGKISYGEEALMHLHVWEADKRQQGIGRKMVLKSLEFYFRSFQFKRILCEPNILNEAPNKTLARVGFTFLQSYQPTPGIINFPHTQNQWEMTRERFHELLNSSSTPE
jgi:ribosomal-protein-alanine N-acetyltransferase